MAGEMEVTLKFKVGLDDVSEQSKEELAARMVDGSLLNVDNLQNVADIEPMSAEIKQVTVTVKDYLKKEAAVI